MVKLSELTDYPQIDAANPAVQPAIVGNQLPDVGPPLIGDGGQFSAGNSVVNRIVDRLAGTGSEERYQTWPERLVRDAVTGAHKVMTGEIPLDFRNREDYTDIPYEPKEADKTWLGSKLGLNPVAPSRSDPSIEAAFNMAALGGTGGLAGATDATLGAGPFLRPALKYGDRIYKAPVKDPANPLFFGAEHSDAIPSHLAPDFYKKAMAGEDINDYKFGFTNHKGQFMSREDATDYAAKEGLADPRDIAYNGGILTSTMMSDTAKPGVAIESMKHPFYSATENAVNNISQAKMTGDQWLNTIANKPGVKPDELQWTGLKDFLNENKGQPVTKEQVQQHLENNKVEIGDIDKGTGEYHYIQQNSNLENHLRYFDSILPEFKSVEDVALAKQHNQAFNETVKGHSDKDVFAAIQEAKKPISDVFHGSSQRYDTKAEAQSVIDNAGLQNHMNVVSEPNVGTKYQSYQLPGGENYREKLLTLPREKLGKEVWETGGNRSDNQYKSSHWDEPNVLAHTRMTDRTIDGQKSLHLEEIQSDWHQAGREHGYANNAKNTENDELYRTLGGTNKTPVPNAPFKSTEQWTGLVLKRMIREAAEKGYDKLSWTPGELQPTNPKNLGQTGAQAEATSKGLQKYYDEIVPKVVEKISGQKVKSSNLNMDTAKTRDAFKEWLRTDGAFPNMSEERANRLWANGKDDALVAKFLKTREPAQVHYIDIPQALKDKAMHKGFPLFAGGYQFTPVAGNPFDASNQK